MAPATAHQRSSNTVTANELSLLLWYYVRTSDPEDVHTAWDRASRLLFEKELLEVNPDKGVEYRLTERGRCFVEKVLTTPLPVQTWWYPEDLK